MPRQEPALAVHARDASGRLSLERPFYGCFVPRLYNQVRPHSALGYLTPEEFAKSWATTGGGKDAGGTRLENAPRFPLSHSLDGGQRVVTKAVLENPNPEKVSLSVD